MLGLSAYDRIEQAKEDKKARQAQLFNTMQIPQTVKAGLGRSLTIGSPNNNNMRDNTVYSTRSDAIKNKIAVLRNEALLKK